MRVTVALSIAGFDPSGGAGVIADCVTFAALGCYPSAVVTSVTYQNTRGVTGFEPLKPGSVVKQLKSVVEDYKVAAVKVGMLGSAEIAEKMAVHLAAFASAGTPVVCDTVFSSSGGTPLFEGAPADAYREYLFPYCSLITPNAREASVLTNGKEIDPKAAAKTLFEELGVPVLVKGGHLPGRTVTDVLYDDGGLADFARERLSGDFHGTGCLLSAAITAYLARGERLRRAVSAAEDYVTGALAGGVSPGSGRKVPGGSAGRKPPWLT